MHVTALPWLCLTAVVCVLSVLFVLSYLSSRWRWSLDLIALTWPVGVAGATKAVRAQRSLSLPQSTFFCLILLYLSLHLTTLHLHTAIIYMHALHYTTDILISTPHSTFIIVVCKYYLVANKYLSYYNLALGVWLPSCYDSYELGHNKSGGSSVFS